VCVEINRKNTLAASVSCFILFSLSRALCTSFRLLYRDTPYRMLLSSSLTFPYRAFKIPFTRALGHNLTFRTSLIELEVGKIILRVRYDQSGFPRSPGEPKRKRAKNRERE